MITRPRIGITSSPLRGDAYYATYKRAVEAAGGEPVTITPLERPRPEDVTLVLASIDGFLAPGGWDVAPEEYGEARPLDMTHVDPPLDRTEIALVRGALVEGLPVFGICRGQQLINVALGGSLVQHIDGHDMHGHPRGTLAHEIQVVAGSELSAVAPVPLHVNSLHHQAVKNVAPGLRVTAHSPDGIVEGVESEDAMVVAVQCHPEELVDEHAWARALFRRFIERVEVRARAARASLDA
jgi:putative glutamine amidotransferase